MSVAMKVHPVRRSSEARVYEVLNLDFGHDPNAHDSNKEFVENWKDVLPGLFVKPNLEGKTRTHAALQDKPKKRMALK